MADVLWVNDGAGPVGFHSNAGAPVCHREDRRPDIQVPRMGKASGMPEAIQWSTLQSATR